METIQLATIKSLVLRTIACGLIILGLVGCNGANPHYATATVKDALQMGQGDFAQALTPRPLRFPQDHGPHPDYRTEWWYYTGNLQDDQGQQYGYQLTFFRSALAATMPARGSDLVANQLYMAHFALTSQPADRHVSFEHFSRGAGGLAGAVITPTFEVWLEDWSAQQDSTGLWQLQAQSQNAAGDFALALQLEETRPIILHGQDGLSQKGPEPGNANYYYSLAQLKTTGVITFAGQAIPITGLSWMDHEFGTSFLSGDIKGWDWFSVQLTNGIVMMFGEFHDGTGAQRRVYAGTLAYPDGRHETLAQGDFVVHSLEQWRSPDTEITYPARWQVQLPKQKIDLTITPLIADQEMEVNFVYYEGATTIQANVDGVAVAGVGYVELTGYGQVTTEFQR